LGRPVRPGPYRTAEPSPDGRTIALRQIDATTGGRLSVIDSNGGSEVRLSANPAAELAPRWSPDGKAIVFGSGRDGGALLLKRFASTAEEQALLASPRQDVAPTDWSVDGHYIVYEQKKGTTDSDIW